ncbi:MAG TPA: endonuclease NucS domain-containing protein, partial [Microcoleus sp.]|nr:endonuclease NucS domain-containing protein [Microcoleus sp.]
MLSSAALRKTGSGWEFANEEALEDFVEVHLQSLLGLTVIKRQFTVNEQRCDIIAVDENKRLVVLELKNGEDRYVVQQLTRYYDALLEHKPFGDRVDYAQPVRLIAITPKFHRDNFTDRKYHGLFFQFLQFAIVPDGEKLYLHFKDVDAEHIARVEITYQERESTEDIPSPPKALLKLLSNCELSQQQEILKTRQKVLCFDKRMEEVVSAGSIKYGNGNSKNSKFCAELCS